MATPASLAALRFFVLRYAHIVYSPNVEVIRANEGAAPAPQEACLRQASDPVSGSASSFVVSDQIFDFKGLLGAPNVKDVNRFFMYPVIKPTRFDPDLTIVSVVKLLYGATEADKALELVGCRKNSSCYGSGSFRFIQRDEIDDRFELRQGWLRPDYFSHLDKRRFASA
jgi:hypothetical protein